MRDKHLSLVDSSILPNNKEIPIGFQVKPAFYQMISIGSNVKFVQYHVKNVKIT